MSKTEIKEEARLIDKKEESQDELWSEAQDDIKNKIATYSNDVVCDIARWAVEALQDKWDITRKEIK